MLLPDVLDALQPAAGGVYIDATVGGGGHTTAIFERIQPGGRLLGMDADPAALQTTRARLQALPADVLESTHYTLVAGHFGDIGLYARQHHFDAVDGIVFDLGVSSYQLDTPQRGFSFRADAPLDMRFDPSQEHTAADLLAKLSEQELADIFYFYGEERYARRIARRIVEQRQQRPVQTTGELVHIIQASSPGTGRKAKAKHTSRQRSHHGQRSPIHPATRVFQALRIAVNRELEQLEHALPQAVDVLRPGGRLAVISFHSLEDRIVKQFFRAESGYRGGSEERGSELASSETEERNVRLRIMTRKPVMASDDEIRTNPRSRSAKLRVAERIPQAHEG